jgi:hypothetical protein
LIIIIIIIIVVGVTGPGAYLIHWRDPNPLARQGSLYMTQYRQGGSAATVSSRGLPTPRYISTTRNATITMPFVIGGVNDTMVCRCFGCLSVVGLTSRLVGGSCQS